MHGGASAPLTLRTMLIDLKDEVAKLKLVRSGKIKEGMRLEVPEIDEHFRFKPSNFNVILGHANVGKTSVTLYMMLLYSMKHGVKWLVYSSENEPYTLIKKLIEFMEGNVITKIETQHFENRVQWINEYFKFADPQTMHTYKSILKFGELIHNQWKFDGFLIDPYNSLMKDKDELKGLNGHEYDYLATTHFRMFCKEKKVSIWLNTHAATEALRKKHPSSHEYAEHPIPPMASDVEGGGKFVNRADDFIVIHRYTQHPTDWMYSHIHVRKVKDIDTGGRPTSMDNPIKLKSLPNNVGFMTRTGNLIEYAKREQKDIPF